jgi:predicted glycosyltransferase
MAGRLPPGVPVPEGIERIDLPPLGMDDGHTVVSRDAATDVAAAQARRRWMIDIAVASTRPAVVLVELFPFGRKKFAGEILPMIRAARRQPGGPARIVCSLRDILVDVRRDQQHHDDRARWLCDRYFDAVLVHADPRFARLEDSFRPTRPMRTPVIATGYVVPVRAAAAPATRGAHLLVSAGGGIVGEALYRCAIEARDRWADAPPMRIVAGPFLPEPAWQSLQAMAAARSGIELVRHVPDMVAEMRAARASISQCGYNSALDLIGADVPALVVPYETAGENEQRSRADRLAALGALKVLPADQLSARTLGEAMRTLMGFEPRPAALDLDGAVRSAACLRDLAGQDWRVAA